MVVTEKDAVGWAAAAPPGADVLAVVATCRDELGIASGADLGFNIWLAGAQAPGTVTFHNPAVESITPLAPPHEAGAGHWNWGGLVSAEDQALFLSAQGEGAHARGWSEGEDGCVLCGYIECPLPAGQESAGLFFLVPARGLEEAQARAVWSEFEELP